jgi:hypothetical protein
MRGRRDLDKFVARFVHREQARILDLKKAPCGLRASTRSKAATLGNVRGGE